jgi:hypothetical protein
VYKYSLFFSLIFITFNISAASNDPTKPFGYSTVSGNIAENKLVLQSIVQGNGTRTAVINGSLIKQGETFGQYKLTQIDDNSVVLQDGSDHIKLYLFKNTVLK